MTSGGHLYYKGAARPHDVARFGHIAAALRAALQHQQMTAVELQRKLGAGNTSPVVYRWLASKGAPSPTYRAKLHKLLGIPLADLTPKGALNSAGNVVKGPVSAGKAAAAAVPAVMPPAPVKAPTPGRPPFSFTVDAAGEARIVLDVAMPVDQAWPLVRLLADHGLIQARKLDT